jgi:hypothetical protein
MRGLFTDAAVHSGEVRVMPALRQSLVSSVVRRYPFYSGCGTLANHRHVQRIDRAGLRARTEG